MRLVGASMRVQYIGSVEQEAGFFTGAHIWEKSPAVVSDEIVEDGFYINRGTPREGCRLVYMPRDNSDFEFWDTDYIFVHDNFQGDYLISPAEYYGWNPAEATQSDLSMKWADPEHQTAATANIIGNPGEEYVGHV